jgi:hypothetical protein
MLAEAVTEGDNGQANTTIPAVIPGWRVAGPVWRSWR